MKNHRVDFGFVMIKFEKIMLVFLCLTLLMPFLVTNVQAASLTLSTPSKDASINSTFPDWNYGADLKLEVGVSLGIFYRTLVQFDLPPELSGATITSATLSIYYSYSWYPAGGFPAGTIIRASRVTHDWTEGTGVLGAHTQDGITWNEYNYFDGLATATNNWGTPGGDYTLTDSSTVVGPFTAPVWLSWTVTNIVQSWASGTYPNCGFLIKLDPETGGVIGGAFGSKESTYPPAKLEITYTISNGVSELNIALPIAISITTIAYLITRKRLRK